MVKLAGVGAVAGAGGSGNVIDGDFEIHERCGEDVGVWPVD